MQEIAEQYRIIAAGAGWLERVDRGRLRIEGSDAARFLQALVTNDIGLMQPGSGVYAAYLTPQGRMLADMNIYHRGGYLLLETAASRTRWLSEQFDRLVFTEDVRFADVS